MNGRISDLIHLMNNRDKVNSSGFDDIIIDILNGTNITAWELGPNPINFFHDILAFNCDANIMELNRIEALLELPLVGIDWTVQAGIPPKAWEGFFITNDLNENEISFESYEWQWKFSPRSDDKISKIDLVIYDEKLSEVPNTLSDNIVNISLFGAIGEKNVAHHISSIRIVKQVHGEEFMSMSIFRKWFVENVDCIFYKDWLDNLLMQDAS